MTNVKIIKINDRTYLRINDVVELLNNLASSEETDTRNRINELASNIQKAAQEFNK